MKDHRKNISQLKGLPPGTLIYVGEFPDEKAVIDVVKFTAESSSRKTKINPDHYKMDPESPEITWFNLNGLSDVTAVENLGLKFGLHPLLLEDIVNTRQRPKIDDYIDHVMVALKMIYFENDELRTEHVSLVMGKGYVISFQEISGDVFGDVRNRIKNNKGKIRIKRSDYLLFALLDTIVDHYYVILEHIGDKIDELEDELLVNFDQKLLFKIQEYGKTVIMVRRSVYPLREVISQLSKADSNLIEESSEKYFRDLYDHTIHVIETVETYKELISSLKDIYMSAVSNRMNNIMKVLTIIATIFIPLTFIAGIYGMNFDHMPELHWKYGYFAVWALMIGLFIIMLFFFRKKDWI